MKNVLIVAVVLVLSLAAWVEINRETYPPPPDDVTGISKTVNLQFRVTNTDGDMVEMSLNQGGGPNNLVVLFELSDDWVKGRFGLKVREISEKSSFHGNSGKKPDIEKFEKDSKGQKVSTYSFDQMLVKDGKGDTYLQMRYAGSPMALIQSLEIERNFMMPRHISARFVNRGNIEFLAGEYGLDKKINGFWIPVNISM